MIDAIRLSRQIIARGLVTTGSAASADSLVFAFSAFAFQVGEVSQLEKEGRVLPDLGEALFFDVTGFQVEISAAIHFSDM